MTSSQATPAELGLRLICRIEAHAVSAWPATVSERVDGGWVLRATPGLDRGRSNHALTPCRPVTVDEIPGAIARVDAFARQHGITPGIQVSPLSLQRTLMAELDRRGWGSRSPVLVLAAERDEEAWLASAALVCSGCATPAWLSAWARCEPERDVDAHARTVLPRLEGRATFARIDDVAVGIAVERDGIVGLFCVAADPSRRRSGLGTALVRAVLGKADARVAYLQVEESNGPAIALYARLGFREAYRYCQRVAPPAGSGSNSDIFRVSSHTA